jgi:hypothetical protein
LAGSDDVAGDFLLSLMMWLLPNCRHLRGISQRVAGMKSMFRRRQKRACMNRLTGYPFDRSDRIALKYSVIKKI